ncbi:hypothetical protein GCM10022198_23770 [Klugiella xanthotipulae]|uniref:Putative membrane protein n=1 Tax=Klugiella xanthotipulae TaxID=244735 RepID=A0A543I6E1_9MICO|nr:YhgE/Pip family protein [Klugiella xanthotipulae]TQM66176.1 putative membrane protein [Klugiella xanthotipulae]
MSRLSLDGASSTRLNVWTILGLVITPLIIGSVLVWGLWNPASRLPEITGAIVNNDVPVTVGEQLTPLGRLLTGELVNSDAEENFTWVVTNEEDAQAGLADGSYATVVTIPKNFSKAATSFSGDAQGAVQATLDIATSPQSKLVDSALSSTVTTAAARALSQQLTETYVDNLYVGFNTLGDKLGDASTGATTLAEGATKLGDGATILGSGAAELSTGLSTLSSGASQLSTGVSALAAGASGLSSGITTLAAGATTADTGAQELSAALNDMKTSTTALPQTVGYLAGQAGTSGTEAAGMAASAGALAAGTTGAAKSAAALVITLQELSTACDPNLGADCAGLAAALESARAVSASAGTANISAGTLAATAVTHAKTAGTVAAVVGTPDSATPTLASGLVTLAGGISKTADGAATLSTGVTSLTQGIGQLGTGASQLSAGATTAATGAGSLAVGATSAQTGANALATGATGIADGATSLSGGASTLGDGLGQAVAGLPTTTDAERSNLASVVANPVTAGSATASLFDASGVPFFATLALWVGGLISFLLLRAVPRRTLTAAQPALTIASRGIAPGLIVGVLQGVLVAGVMQFALSLNLLEWLGFAAFAALTGAAYGAVNQGLVAVFGGVGRFVSMVITVLSLAAGIVSTVPEVYTSVLSALPLAAGIDGMRAIANGTTGAYPAAAALIAWLLVGCALTLFTVVRQRSMRFAPARLAALAS